MNLQQIPAHSNLGRKIKSCFIPRNGYKIVSSDLSQIELRLLAEFSQEPLWIKTFRNNEDLHSVLCAETFNIPIKDVNLPFPPKPDITYRYLQKTINFMTIYGGSKFALADTAQIEIQEANNILNRFFRKVPKVKEFLEMLAHQAVFNGYIRNNSEFGRIRFFNNINENSSFKQKSEVERAAKNSPMQGSNADILKLALINLQEIIDKDNLPVHILLNIHDEIVTECKEDFVDVWKYILEDVLIKAAETIIKSIPVKADTVVSDYWTD